MSQARTSGVGGNRVLLKVSEKAAKKTSHNDAASLVVAWVTSNVIFECV